jgi:secretion/DNA translocation related TadE-like protein
VSAGSRADRGSASVWVLACSALVLLIGVATSLRTAAVLARHRAESAADFAALAAADRIGVGNDSCAAAAALAAANGAALVRCRTALGPDGRTGTVDVWVSLAVRLPVLGVERVVATARAGRLAAEGSSRHAGWAVRRRAEESLPREPSGSVTAACDGTRGCLAPRAPAARVTRRLQLTLGDLRRRLPHRER